MNEPEISFEEGLRRLDQIVRSLEKGDVALADSMRLFEEGTALLRRCGDMLDQAEQKVLLLRRGADGTPQTEPFPGTV